MKKISATLALLLIVCVLACVLYGYFTHSIDVVLFLPNGFVLLEDILSDGNLEMMYWETQISFVNSDQETVYQTSVNNDDCIVRYKGELYIHEDYIPKLIGQGDK